MNKANFCNYLLTSDVKQNSHTSDKLFEFAVKEAGKSAAVIYFRHKQFQILPLIDGFEFNKDILKRMTFIYFDTLEEAGERILELRTWNIKPSLVILDFSEFLDEKVPLSNECIRKFCLLIAFVINFSYRFYKKFAIYCKTITFLEVNDTSVALINKLVDLYFHNTNFTSLKCIIDYIK